MNKRYFLNWVFKYFEFKSNENANKYSFNQIDLHKYIIFLIYKWQKLYINFKDEISTEIFK